MQRRESSSLLSSVLVVRGPSSSCHILIFGDRVGRYHISYFAFVLQVLGFDNDTMAALAAPQAPAPRGKEKLDSRLFGICMANGVGEPSMDVLATTAA